MSDGRIKVYTTGHPEVGIAEWIDMEGEDYVRTHPLYTGLEEKLSTDNLEPSLVESIEVHPDLPLAGSFGNDRPVCVRVQTPSSWFYRTVRTPPNWFHRQMQRLVLGIKWEKYDE